MEEDQEQRFVCKICSKSFINGKCLGGHMRGHASEISARNQENSNFGDKGLEDHDDASYGLRENPKKTWRVSNGIQSVEENRNSCKECGRDFSSLRALSGHLRSHSNKEKEKHICKQCGKGFDSMRALFGHMRHHSNKRSRVKNVSVESQTDYETVCPIKKKRSKLRYKIAGNSVSNLNPSLKFSEIDEEEEAALCLLMLSSGLTIWFDFVSECSSSENDFLMAKAKALQGKDISKSNSSLNSSKKFEYESGDLDCGYFENNEQEAYLGVSSDGFRNNNFGIKFSDSEIGRGSETTEVELGKELGLDQADSEIKSKTGNEVRFDDQDLEFGEDSFGGINISDSVSKLFENAEKKPVFKCKSCNKIFHSCRALGGHRASHKPITNSFIANSETKSELETDEHLDEMEIGEETMTNYELKKNKDHECPICFKVFSSGQALGGHKRAHYKRSSGNKIKERMVTNQELGGVIDLNLLEKEVNSDAGLKPWFKGMKWNELDLFL